MNTVMKLKTERIKGNLKCDRNKTQGEKSAYI